MSKLELKCFMDNGRVLRFKRINNSNEKENGWISLPLEEAIYPISKSEQLDFSGFCYRQYYQALLVSLMALDEQDEKLIKKLRYIDDFEQYINVFLSYISDKRANIPEHEIAKDLSIIEKCSIAIKKIVLDRKMNFVYWNVMKDRSNELKRLIDDETKILGKERCFALLIRDGVYHISISGTKRDYVGKKYSNWGLSSKYKDTLHQINEDLFGGCAKECHLTDDDPRKRSSSSFFAKDILLKEEENEGDAIKYHGCCERKIIGNVGKTKRKDVWYIKYSPCEKCMPYLYRADVRIYKLHNTNAISAYPNLIFKISGDPKTGGFIIKIARKR